MAEGYPPPLPNDVEREEETSKGIKPPEIHKTPQQREDDGEDIEDNCASKRCSLMPKVRKRSVGMYKPSVRASSASAWTLEFRIRRHHKKHAPFTTTVEAMIAIATGPTDITVCEVPANRWTDVMPT